MKCGRCGRSGKASAKGWRWRGPSKAHAKWARCPECVALWKDERLRERQMDDEFRQRLDASSK